MLAVDRSCTTLPFQVLIEGPPLNTWRIKYGPSHSLGTILHKNLLRRTWLFLFSYCKPSFTLFLWATRFSHLGAPSSRSSNSANIASIRRSPIVLKCYSSRSNVRSFLIGRKASCPYVSRYGVVTVLCPFIIPSSTSAITVRASHPCWWHWGSVLHALLVQWVVPQHPYRMKGLRSLLWSSSSIDGDHLGSKT